MTAKSIASSEEYIDVENVSSDLNITIRDGNGSLGSPGSSGGGFSNRRRSTEGHLGDDESEIDVNVDPELGFPRLNQWILDTFGIPPKPDKNVGNKKDSKKKKPTVQPEIPLISNAIMDIEGPVEIKEDEDDKTVIEEALGSNLGSTTWIGRLSYQWFCMDEKLNVLNSCFPNPEDVPLYIDITREVNRRWKALTQERKNHYIEIATYQYETEFGSLNKNNN